MKPEPGVTGRRPVNVPHQGSVERGLLSSLETNHTMPQEGKQADAGIKMASVPVWVSQRSSEPRRTPLPCLPSLFLVSAWGRRRRIIPHDILSPYASGVWNVAQIMVCSGC